MPLMYVYFIFSDAEWGLPKRNGNRHYSGPVLLLLSNEPQRMIAMAPLSHDIW